MEKIVTSTILRCTLNFKEESFLLLNCLIKNTIRYAVYATKLFFKFGYVMKTLFKNNYYHLSLFVFKDVSFLFYIENMHILCSILK